MAKILLVEDDTLLRDVLAQFLRQAGHSVAESANGRGALELMRSNPAAVVITDLVMPEVEGIEMIVTLRKEFARVPIIAMSGAVKNSPVYLQLASKLGATWTLAKPFSVEELKETVDRALALQDK